MKQRIRILLVLAVLLGTILTACDKTPQPDTEVGNSQTGQTEQTQQEEQKEQDEEIKPQKSAILEGAEDLGEGYVYHVPNKRIERALQQEIALFEDNLLVWGSGQSLDGEQGFHVSLISRQTGDVLQEKTFADMDLPNAQVCGDKVAVIDWGLGKVILLNKSFEVLGEYTTDTSYCGIYLDEKATNIYCFTQNGIKVIDIASGKTSMLVEEATMLFSTEKCGYTVGITYTDKQTQMNENAVVDLTKGTIEKIPYDGAFQSVEYSENIWFAGVIGREDTYYLGKADRPKSFVPHGEHTLVTMIANPLRLMATSYDDYGRTSLAVYSLDGKFLSQTKLSENVASVIFEPIWSEADGGYFLIAIDNTGKDQLLFWDMSIPNIGEDLTLKAEYEENVSSNSKVSKELLDRAEQIASKYEVEILLGDQTEDSYGEFNALHEMGEAYISEGLDALESALSKYPENFMKQLIYGDQRKLEFHLTGAFTLKEYPEGDVNGFTYYIGLAQEAAGKNLVIVDITMASSIEETIHHELMHIIDFKLRFDANVRKDAVYSEEAWMALNPKGFTYVEDKFHLPESIYNDGYEEYFIDLYSRTDAKEDRARIMEYAMADEEWAFSNADGRYEKLEYLSECIRDAFDTKGWPAKTVWEKTLDRSR